MASAGSARKWLVFAGGGVALAAVLTVAALTGTSDSPVLRAIQPGSIPADDFVLAKVGPSATSEVLDDAGRITQASALIIASRETADPRNLGRAQALLAPWRHRTGVPDEVRVLRATIAQALHQFAQARDELDEVIARGPGHLSYSQAILTRAAIVAVQGDYDQLAADCAMVAGFHGALVAASCAAPMAAVQGKTQQHHAELRALLESAQSPPPEVATWAWTALGEIARKLGDDVAAESHFAAALRRTPGDPYTLGMLADLLLDGDRFTDVVELLEPHAQAETLLLRLCLAELVTRPDAGAQRAEVLRERFALAEATRVTVHDRELARFLLAVEGDPARALERALDNWKVQREPLDARLVLEAAAAAGDPSAAAPVLDWMDRWQLRDAVLTAARKRLERTR
jgi:Tfp pilus assembly protein PilF